MATKTKNMLEKLEMADPYNIFNNTISKIPSRADSILFTDLLCPSLGQLKCSLQITSKVDIEWLMEKYESRGLGSKPLTLLYGEEKPEMEEYIKKNLPNVTQHCVAVNDQFGSHHAKMGIYVYEDNSLRVVVSTSNLYENHWDHFNHCFWVSPPCLQLPKNFPGESPTNFKSTLLTYLQQYNLPSILKTWIDFVKRADFSNVRVFLVTSFPGCHSQQKPGTHLQQMESLLKEHWQNHIQDWPIVIQTSCIGQYGESPEKWVKPVLLKSLGLGLVAQHRAQHNTPFHMIFPTVENVKNGIFGEEIGCGLRYLGSIHERQKWLQDYLYQWKADRSGRTGVMAHSKTYFRVSPCYSKMAWFLLTTANATRGAWGQKKYFYSGMYMRNYEVGILFLPKFFDQEYFSLSNKDFYYGDDKAFPMVPDLPLTKYGSGDQPWTVATMDKITQKCMHQFASLELQ